jgi:hypothetical protein
MGLSRVVVVWAACTLSGATARGYIEEKAHDADTALCDPVKQYTG